MSIRKPRAFTDFTPLKQSQDDPFRAEDQEELEPTEEILHKVSPRRFPFGKILISALLLLVILALGVWIENFIYTLFSQYSLLGWLALGLAGIALIALIGFFIKELVALRRLAKVEHLRQQASEALLEDGFSKARQTVKDLIVFTKNQPLTAKGRATLQRLDNEIIDGKDLIHLAESEILAPLDREARALILSSSKRVCIVTALSPRAFLDMAYVLYESLRLVHNLANLYGCRPGKLGSLSIIKRVLVHLVVTGSIALSDGLVQQFIGQSFALRLSKKIGEGLINGLMTTRIGIAALDALRPLPFDGQKRPSLSDFTKDLAGFTQNASEQANAQTHSHKAQK